MQPRAIAIVTLAFMCISAPQLFAQDVEVQVRSVVAQHAGVHVSEVELTDTFVSLGLTGQAKASAIAELELIFGVVLQPIIDEIITVGDAVEAIEEQLNNLQ